MTFLKTLAMAALMAISANAAGIEGKWTAEFDTQIGVQKYAYEFKLVEGKLTGTATGPQGAVAISEGKSSGEEVEFVENMKFQGQELRIEYKGRLAGDQINFTRKVADFATEELVAKRSK